MSRSELVAVIRLLNRSISLDELGALTVPELRRCFIKLKARRLQAINERRRQDALQAQPARPAHNLPETTRPVSY